MSIACGREARGTTLLASDVAHEGDITPVVHPRPEGPVEDAAAGRWIPWADHAGDMPFLVRLEEPDPQSDVVLVGEVDALVCRHNAREDQVSPVIEIDTEVRSREQLRLRAPGSPRAS